jgi:hypothetical protein
VILGEILVRGGRGALPNRDLTVDNIHDPSMMQHTGPEQLADRIVFTVGVAMGST